MHSRLSTWIGAITMAALLWGPFAPAESARQAPPEPVPTTGSIDYG